VQPLNSFFSASFSESFTKKCPTFRQNEVNLAPPLCSFVLLCSRVSLLLLLLCCSCVSLLLFILHCSFCFTTLLWCIIIGWCFIAPLCFVTPLLTQISFCPLLFCCCSMFCNSLAWINTSPFPFFFWNVLEIQNCLGGNLEASKLIVSFFCSSLGFFEKTNLVFLPQFV